VVSSDNSDYFIRWYTWVNDERLLVSVRFGATRNLVETMETRLMSVNRDGTQAKETLITPRTPHSAFGGDHYSQWQDRVIAFLPDDPKHVLISLDKNNPNSPDVYRLNVYSGRLTLVQGNPGNAHGFGTVRTWIADRQGRVRVSIGGERSLVRLMVRPADSDEFEELAEYDRTKERGLVPLGFDEDPSVLYVRAIHESRWAVFKIRLGKGERTRELVAADPDYDIEGRLLYSRRLKAVIGVGYSADDEGRVVYWDKRVQHLPSRVDRALPGRRNLIVSSTDDNRSHVVLSSNPSQPPQFHIFDSEHDRMVKLADMYQNLPAAAMSVPKSVLIMARDGLQLHGYLTTPKDHDARGLPLVLFPYGAMGQGYRRFQSLRSVFCRSGMGGSASQFPGLQRIRRRVRTSRISALGPRHAGRPHR
jgi:dipeptidyl aminopeptidase/acylaminoacyl peptidase